MVPGVPFHCALRHIGPKIFRSESSGGFSISLAGDARARRKFGQKDRDVFYATFRPLRHAISLGYGADKLVVSRVVKISGSGREPETFSVAVKDPGTGMPTFHSKWGPAERAWWGSSIRPLFLRLLIIGACALASWAIVIPIGMGLLRLLGY
jgi:hypothetical protein